MTAEKIQEGDKVSAGCDTKTACYRLAGDGSTGSVENMKCILEAPIREKQRVSRHCL